MFVCSTFRQKTDLHRVISLKVRFNSSDTVAPLDELLLEIKDFLHMLFRMISAHRSKKMREFS